MKISTEEFVKLFAGKSVAIVGNANSLLKQDYGWLIDAHDVVCRFNTGATHARDYEKSGRRTTVSFFNVMRAWLPEEGISVHVSRRAREESDPDYFIPISTIDEIAGIIDVDRPSSGMMVNHFIHEYAKPARVSLFGFDFKATKTWYHQKEGRLDPHDYVKEGEYTKTILANDLMWSIY
jgi:hypothetical protein